jgi:hypothetical protein
VAASAETGSTLALVTTNGQYETAPVATNLTDNFGIECWVNPSSTAAGGHVLAHNGLRGNGWGLYQAGANFEVLYGGVIFFGSAPAAAGTWTHLALVRSNGVAILYANGVPNSTNSAAVPITPSGSFTVGGDASFSEYFTGAIDEVRVFTFASGAFSTNDLLLNSTNIFVSNTNDNGAGSLRAAVTNARSGAVITFATNLSGQTILLTNGQIELINSVTIDASALAKGMAINGNGQSRIFYVDGGVTAMLNNLIITNGSDGGGVNQGGGVVNYGSLTINRCTVAGNQANSSDGGGGICNETGTLTVNNSTFTGNQANNSFFGGGGICAGGDGDGGIVNVNNCTFAGNQAEHGGAVAVAGGTVNINNSTISGNQGSGGGVDIFGGLLNLTNSIVCGNIPDNIDAPINSGTHNLVDANALLAPLGNYGGPTQTMPPLAGSAAIDAGLDSVTNSLATDQRGHPRLSGSHVDIGAVEVNPNTIVTTNSDDSNPGSLRNVVANTTTTDLISFAPNLSGQTILLTNGQIELANNVTIDGSTLAGGIQINGNASSRVFQVNATAVLNALTVTNAFSGFGGSIVNYATLTVKNCTFAGNQAANFSDGGGAIENWTSATLTIINSTFTGNQVPGSNNDGGGAIVDEGGTLTIINSTIVGNSAAGQFGGGIKCFGTLLLTNTIVCSNVAFGSPNIAAAFSITSNLVDTNALLAPLGNYGGPTPTMPPLGGSPAIDAGSDASASLFATDQRGFPRLAGAHVDIGAVEFQYGLVVSNSADSGENTLRAAVAYDPPGSMITFAPALSGQTITLTNGQLTIATNLTIDGSGLPNGVQISGNHNSRIFNINTNVALTLVGLTMVNANGGGADGGALYNAGNSILNYCTFTGNSTGSGGAIKNANGSLVLNECTLYGNSTLGGGGGGVVNYAALFLNGCTLTGNSAGSFGGAVYSESGAHVTLDDTIAAGNTANDIYNNGTLTLTGSNMVQSISGSHTGTTPINASPSLAALGNYGGPTPSMPPLPGSPAIDAGDDSEITFLPNDQRGYPRKSGAHVDIGAVEAQVAPANNQPVLKNVLRSAINHTLQFTFTNVPHADFNVLTSTNVAAPLSNWSVLSGVMETTPGQYQFLQNGATNPAQFSRVVSP